MEPKAKRSFRNVFESHVLEVNKQKRMGAMRVFCILFVSPLETNQVGSSPLQNPFLLVLFSIFRKQKQNVANSNYVASKIIFSELLHKGMYDVLYTEKYAHNTIVHNTW